MYHDSLTKTQDPHVNRRRPPKDSERLSFNYFGKTMQYVEYKVKKPKHTTTTTKKHKTETTKEVKFSCYFCSICFLLIIIQFLALLNKVNIANNTLSSLEKLMRCSALQYQRACLSVCSFQYIVKSNNFFQKWQIFFFSCSSLLSPS